MATIIGDSAASEKELQTLVKLIEEGGGGLHSNLVISAENGCLNVATKEPMDENKEIIRLSRSVLLPSDQYTFSAKNDEFIFDFPAQSNFTDLQKRLTECMVNLYNMTDKAADYKKTSFILSIINYPELLDFFDRGRNFSGTFKLSVDKLLRDDLAEEDVDTFIGAAFFNTRPLGYADYIRESKVSVLMPVIDFLNHHWAGASFSVLSGTRPGDLVIQNRQPIENSNDCYAYYGTMDALDTLVRYDFVDAFAPIISSIPVDLEVPENGTIRIEGRMGNISKKQLDKEMRDLVRHMPSMELDKDDDTVLNVSHLFIPTNESRLALRRILQVLLVELVGLEFEEDFYALWIRNAEIKVIEKNIEYYTEMQACIQKHIQEEGESFGLQRVQDMADIQLKGLQSYECAG